MFEAVIEMGAVTAFSGTVKTINSGCQSTRFSCGMAIAPIETVPNGLVPKFLP